MTSYCASVRNLPENNVHRQHHDAEHGFPPKDDNDLFRRLMLEISQAGLSFVHTLGSELVSLHHASFNNFSSLSIRSPLSISLRHLPSFPQRSVLTRQEHNPRAALKAQYARNA